MYALRFLSRTLNLGNLFCLVVVQHDDQRPHGADAVEFALTCLCAKDLRHDMVGGWLLTIEAKRPEGAWIDGLTPFAATAEVRPGFRQC